MTLAMGESLGNSEQRSFWLRCFLGAPLLLVGLIGLFSVVTAQAQIEVESPLHIRHVRGYVTDEKGNAISFATMVLLQDGKPTLNAVADKTGWFQIDRASGRYVLSSSEGNEAGREITVGTNLIRLFRPSTLYVMLRPKAVCMDCSIRVFTSKKKFFDAVWQKTGHYY